MFGGYAHVISHTVARNLNHNRGPIEKHHNIWRDKIKNNILSFPRAGGPPNSLPKVDGAGIKYFWGTIGFFCGARKKIRIVPLASVIDLSLMGGPPLGGSPPLIKDRFFRKIRKRNALSRPYAHFGPQKPCFWGGTQNRTFLAVFRGFVGYPGDTPPIQEVCKKTNRHPCLAATRM